MEQQEVVTSAMRKKLLHLWYNCRALAVTAIAVHRTIATAIVRRLDCQNISLYEPEQSLSLSQDEGEQC